MSMNKKFRIFYFFIPHVTSIFLLTGCTGAILGGAPKEVSDLEEAGTRAATEEEEKRLDTCLHNVFKKQQRYFSQYQKYITTTRELKEWQPKGEPSTDDFCEEIQVSVRAKDNEEKADRARGYTATAKIKDGKNIVKWTLQESGEVTEHDDMNFDFSL